MPDPGCPLCLRSALPTLWQNDELRVVDVADSEQPGFTRVIWRDHVAEMTQLDRSARQRLMDVVWIVEQTMRDHLQPDKINLAEFGNQVPHLHWHIIPRWSLDSHYPHTIWAAPTVLDSAQSQAWAACRTQIANKMPAYQAALRQALESL